jgi:hypothetical protein
MVQYGYQWYKKGDIVWDLYCGIGMLGKKEKTVIQFYSAESYNAPPIEFYKPAIEISYLPSFQVGVNIGFSLN